jgi:opacity protein-like surface antigen
MPPRAFFCDSWKLYFPVCLLSLLASLALSPAAQGQALELGGGWAHVTGNNGTDGFDIDAAWWFTKHITVAFNYDSTWDSTTLGNFTFTQTGAIAVKSHLQTFLAGPRIFFSTSWTDKYKLNPFGEAQFGGGHLWQKIEAVNKPSVSASGTDFAWLLGGGVEYLLSPHWSGRANLDFLRTNFANEGQNHFRFVLGITYTLGERGKK